MKKLILIAALLLSIQSIAKENSSNYKQSWNTNGNTTFYNNSNGVNATTTRSHNGNTTYSHYHNQSNGYSSNTSTTKTGNQTTTRFYDNRGNSRTKTCGPSGCYCTGNACK